MGETILLVDDEQAIVEPLRYHLERAHIFERFYRGAEARSGGEKGAGRGLAIVKCVVESQHGGRVWAESEIGQGTTVHFTLPVNPPASWHSFGANVGQTERKSV